jgi:uncharacterized integral membrane protein
MKLPQMMRNLWIYRRIVVLAVILGIALFFIGSNREPLKVTFPFLGGIDSTSGIVMLASAVLGAAACWLVMTFRQALREARGQRAETERPKPALGSDERRRGSEPEVKKTEGLPRAGP